jgi:hypothetical protein
MRRILVLAGLIVLWASVAGAQGNAIQSWNLSSVSLVPSPFAASTTPAAVPSGALGLPGGLPASSPLNPAVNGGPEPQQVQGVFVTYDWQAYFGYTFLKFYEVPGLSPNTNGFNFSVQYYFKDWFAADGEFVGTHVTQGGQGGWFVFGGGGPRFRWSLPRGVELWGHGLVGYSHFGPQTPYGGQNAFAYELGAGVDFNIHHQKWALRLAGDMIGTTYFGTEQYSPKFSAGVVYKF